MRRRVSSRNDISVRYATVQRQSKDRLFHARQEHTKGSSTQYLFRDGCRPERGQLVHRPSLQRKWLHGARRPTAIESAPQSGTCRALLSQRPLRASIISLVAVIRSGQQTDGAPKFVWCKPGVGRPPADGLHSARALLLLRRRRPQIAFKPASLLSEPHHRGCHHLLTSTPRFTAMPIESRFSVDVPRCSIQQWIFGSPTAPLPDCKAWIDADDPSHFLSLPDARLLAKRIAVGLKEHGVLPGDRVMVYSGNSIYFPVLVLGIWMAGCIFTGANPGFTARELAFQLRDSEASVLLATTQNGKTALEAAQSCGMEMKDIFWIDSSSDHGPFPSLDEPRCDRLITAPRLWTRLIAPESKALMFQWEEPEKPEDAVCTLNYSSGTTGLPKGVEITHFNHVANSIAVEAFDELGAERETDEVAKASLCILPMYHAYCQLFYMCNLPRASTPVYVMPHFDFPRFLQHIARYRITSVMAVPTVLNLVAKHPLASKVDLSSILAFGSGAAPLAAQTQIAVLNMLRPGAMVRQGWGMSELTSTGLVWDPTREMDTAIGELIPGNQARLVDIATGMEITKANTPGELWISSPTLMRGYWRNPQATASAISTDEGGRRWLRTGDIVFVDKYGPGALFYIVGRAKELIKVKGFQVAPAELEALLLQRPDIADAAVIGVAADGTERPRAYVVRAPDTHATAVDIEAWVAERVARYKQLEGGVCFVDPIPKNSVSFL
ncbi:hypothetical protein NLU13_0030 [Sarocladium strictum]|uniref:Uncharacterized protein n=1 Tax=Sarocladium strictum TaxID=5046 RepID=A0AA39LAG2_SARSR|nr:hypothetical protein NLU13_0030 [Sarocladium strictum]